MSTENIPHDEDTRPAVVGPVERVVRPPFENAYGVPLRGFESAMGGLYKGEHVALEVSAPDGMVHALVRFADVEHAYREREELAMMIRMLTSSLKRHTPHAPQPGDLPSRAVELLRKYGLMGSPLRDECEDRGPQQAA
jgi:hypothetical protein